MTHFYLHSLDHIFKMIFTSDEEMEVNEDHLSDLEDVVEKVTDKLGLCFDKYEKYVPFYIQIEDLDVYSRFGIGLIVEDG